MPGVPAGGAFGRVRAYARALDVRYLAHGQRGILLFAQGRSGSTLLGELIGSHPQVVFADEILGEPVRFPRLFVASRRARHPHRWYAFHVKVYQLTQQQDVHNPNRWLRSMHRLGWKVVYLHRRNIVRQVLSTNIALDSGAWHRREPGERPALPVVPPTELRRGIDMRMEAAAMERAALDGVPHVRVSYEDDLLDPDGRQPAMDRVFRHLGLPSAPVESGLVRTGANRLEEIVANADELRAALEGTEWRPLLEQG